MKQVLLFLALLAGCLSSPTLAAQPNVVVIFIDDMGYADIGPTGCERYPTPNLDRMASEGRVFTDFHSATAVCSASRAALLTGCYPERVSVLGALFPGDRTGLHPDEITIAEICKSQDYATACFGKWHLGDSPEFLPTEQGFDEYFGLLYSNDMWPYKDGETTFERGKKQMRGEPYPSLPLYEGEKVVDADVTPDDQKQLTTRYTEHAVDFINRQAGKTPFFLYLPHSMVHIPLFVSEKFAGKSGAGIYGDVVMELDWSVGEVLKALRENGIDEQTLVIFTSDNGPWLVFGDHGGSAGPLREGKGTMFEGGQREPCVMRWPSVIPAGTRSGALGTTMDLLPTIAGLIGAEVPSDRVIDGQDILPIMTGEEDAISHSVLYGYYGRQLQTIRSGKWKLHLPHPYRTLGGREPGTDGKSVPYKQAKIDLSLFDLEADLGETTDVSDQHPEVVERLLEHAEAARDDLGDRLTGRKGLGVRPAGLVPLAESMEQP